MSEPLKIDMASNLTKRELFAAMCLQGLCASDVMDDPHKFIDASVSLADLLLAELAKEQK